jgi:hypothetical protein
MIATARSATMMSRPSRIEPRAVYAPHATDRRGSFSVAASGVPATTILLNI